LIPPFQAAELRAAIEKPAEQVGLLFEPGLVETLISEFFGEPAALTLLQFTLLKLWDAREHNRITWKAYNEIGGGQRAVEETAEAIYSAKDVSDDERRLIERIFHATCAAKSFARIVACSVPEVTLSRTPADAARVTLIVDRFTRVRLLRVRQASSGQRLVEVSHEAVLRKWPRLWQWLIWHGSNAAAASHPGGGVGVA
jgi:hypothetical protein